MLDLVVAQPTEWRMLENRLSNFERLSYRRVKMQNRLSERESVAE
jgi:hypothetical protein